MLLSSQTFKHNKTSIKSHQLIKGLLKEHIFLVLPRCPHRPSYFG